MSTPTTHVQPTPNATPPASTEATDTAASPPTSPLANPQPSTSHAQNPRVWVGCLGCYNAGDLVGEWWDADQAPTTAEEFTAQIRTPGHHAADAHEELWVMDHDNFHGFLTGECSPSEAAHIAATIEQVRAADVDPDLFAAYCSHIGADKNTKSLTDFTDNYAGTWDSERDFADSWVEDLTSQLAAMGTPVPEPFASYLDVTGYARDLFMEGMFSIALPGGNVAVFHAH